MKIKDIRKLNTAELNKKLAELRARSRELRFSLVNNQLKDVRALRTVKKEIARILSILNENRSK
jgi:large subunit ribosomal protein L29